MSEPETPQRWDLRRLNFSAKVAVAAFLFSVGLGYLSALVNLHFAEATPGNVLPSEDDVRRAYNGASGVSQLERLLVAHPSLPFNGSGSMRGAFTRHRSGQIPTKVLRSKAKALGLAHDDPKVAEAVWKDRDGERVAMIAWVRSGGSEKEFNDGFPLKGDLASLVLTPDMVDVRDDVRYAQINAIVQLRCVRCHSVNAGGPGSQYPLDEYEDFKPYLGAEKSSGKSLAKLALTTHVHLLGFSMLYGLTGLLLALTPLPGWLRLPLAPLPLAAQVVDIAFWWLARLEEPYGPMFASLIRVSGGVVAAGLLLQIILTLFSMFEKLWSWVVLVALFAGASYGAHLAKTHVIDPHLAAERELMSRH
jgi:hypothetical protein